MKKMTLLVTLLTLAVFVSGAMAQQQSPSTKPATAETPKLQDFRGIIVKCDAMAKSIEVKGSVKKEQKTLTFAIDDKTKITEAKTTKTLADLKEGMKASVQYQKDGEKLVAIAIKVSAPKK
jgi:Cu/Ag efflux protein CusF